MKNLIKWLNKNGYSIELITLGEKDYFSIGYLYSAVVVTLETENTTALRQQREKLYKYVNRYGLHIIRECRLQYHTLTNKYHQVIYICSATDAAGAGLYYSFRDKARNDCDDLIHQYYVKGIYHTHYNILNKALKNIIFTYQEAYKRALLAAV